MDCVTHTHRDWIKGNHRINTYTVGAIIFKREKTKKKAKKFCFSFYCWKVPDIDRVMTHTSTVRINKKRGEGVAGRRIRERYSFSFFFTSQRIHRNIFLIWLIRHSCRIRVNFYSATLRFSLLTHNVFIRTHTQYLYYYYYYFSLLLVRGGELSVSMCVCSLRIGTGWGRESQTGSILFGRRRRSFSSSSSTRRRLFYFYYSITLY